MIIVRDTTIDKDRFEIVRLEGGREEIIATVPVECSRMEAEYYANDVSIHSGLDYGGYIPTKALLAGALT